MRANERTDERVAQYLRLYFCLFQTTVPPSPREVRCYAFSPPGGLLNAPAQRLSRECVMSVVLGLDFIPRLSWHTFLHLRDDLMREIERADEPKFEILAAGFCSALGRCVVDCCGQRRRRRRRQNQVILRHKKLTFPRARE